MNKFIDFFIGENSTWVIIGKLSLFLGLIVAIFNIQSFLFPSGPEIGAVCKVEKVPYQQEVPIKKGMPNNFIEPDIESEKSKIVEAFTSALVTQRDLFTWVSEKYFLSCEISNSGTKEADEVVLDLPYSILSAYSGFTKLTVNGEQANSVSFGTIRPKQKIQAAVWTIEGNVATNSNEDDYTLSYIGGVGKIKLPYYAYGWTASVAKFVDFLSKPRTLFFLILFIVSMTFAFMEDSKSKKKPPVDSN